MDTGKILKRLDELISAGENVLKTNQGYVRDSVDTELSHQWSTSSLAFLKAIFSENSVHYKEFTSRCEYPHQGFHARRGLAILKSAREDISGGYLQRVENLVSSNVFSDFLEKAEHLLDNGYKDPAASLIGAVLEDGLRRICGTNNLIVKNDDNISSLNKKIADNDIYNRLQQKEIETWNKIRDYADHGHFSEYDIDKVKNMLSGVRSFLVSQLS
jgi:hypothetical protein